MLWGRIGIIARPSLNPGKGYVNGAEPGTLQSLALSYGAAKVLSVIYYILVDGKQIRQVDHEGPPDVFVPITALETGDITVSRILWFLRNRVIVYLYSTVIMRSRRTSCTGSSDKIGGDQSQIFQPMFNRRDQTKFNVH